MKVANLNPKQYRANGNGIYPIDRMNGIVCGCYDKNNDIPLLWINTKTGNLHFNPSRLYGNFSLEYAKGNDFCGALRESYSGVIKGFSPEKDKVTPLETDN